MSKTFITRLFVAAVVATAAGIAVGFVALLIAISRGVVSVGGPTVVTVDGGALAGLLGWWVLASLLAAGGAAAAVIAWVGALRNTVRLADKTWFVALLVLGLCSFGWLAMAAYVLAGPDGSVATAARTGATTAP